MQAQCKSHTYSLLRQPLQNGGNSADADGTL